MARRKSGNYTHGMSGYSNYACRCPVCTSAWRDWTYDARQRRADSRVLVDGRLVSPLGEHGNKNTYSNRLCRCEPCTAAHRAQYQSRRAS